VATLSPLIGRAEELGLVQRLVREHRLVTVTGTGGVGKTRLVNEVRTAIEAAGTRVVTLRLGNLSGGSDAHAITAEADKASPEALALAFADEPVVVVLDGCDHVLAGAADVAIRFCESSETGVVLTTSRQPLGIPGERVVVLEPLPVPEPGDADPSAAPAVELFLELATASGARWDRSDRTIQLVADLCRAIDGLPLAIELAAARARSLSPAELLALISKHVDALRTPDGVHHELQQSVSAAIGLSVDLLDDDQRDLFQRLGVLVGPFDLGLVHAVAASTVDDHLRAVELVGSLVERSLLVADASRMSTRYRMLELVREHAAADLVAAGLWEETRERLAAAMASEATELLIEGSQRWTGDLIARITMRASSFVASLDWCIQHDEDPRRAYALFVPLFAPAQQRAADVRAVGNRLYERWPDEPGPLRAEALAVRATAHVLGSDFEAGARFAEDAIADPHGTGIATVVAERALTLAAIGRGDHAEALVHARRGQVAAASVPLPPFERELRGFEAALVDITGDPASASVLATEVVVDSVAADDPLTEIWARLVTAMIAIRDDRVADAGEQVDLAQRRSAAIDDAWWGGPIFRARALLAAHATSEDGWIASRELWRAAIERSARLGDLPELTLTLSTAAAAASEHGHHDAAEALLAASPHVPALTVLPEVYERAAEPARTSPAHGLVTAVRAALEALGDAGPPVADRSPSPGSGRMQREGEVWALTFEGKTVRLRDLKGLSDIASLLARAGEEVHCLELMGAADVGGEAGPALDDRARREYQARILELQQEVDEAKDANDPARADRAEIELDALVTELSSAFGLSGRSRSTGSSVERARTAVTYRVRAAVKKVAEQHPALGRHLSHSVRTGTWCAYRPEHEVRWIVERA
jgi:predicted ATPase